MKTVLLLFGRTDSRRKELAINILRGVRVASGIRCFTRKADIDEENSLPLIDRSSC